MTVLPFHDGSTICVVGSTGSGKSYFVKRLLTHQRTMFETPPNRILYCYTVDQPLFREMEEVIENISFHKGFPTVQRLQDLAQYPDQHNVLVLDDLAEETVMSETGKNIFTRHCHHLNITAILLSQNLYTSGKFSRTISLNTHYFCLLKAIRDTNQVKYLARQAFGQHKSFMEAYKDCMQEPYAYLVLDLSPATEDQFRIRSKIFPEERCIVYSS